MAHPNQISTTDEQYKLWYYRLLPSISLRFGYAPRAKCRDSASQSAKAPKASKASKASRSGRRHPGVSEIIPGLFIGNFGAVWDRPTIAQNNITAVVSTLDYRTWTPGIDPERHLSIMCRDDATQDLLKNLDEICDFIDKMISQRTDSTGEGTGNILVHCQVGASRSVTAVIAYLMRKDKKDWLSVLRQVKSKRRIVKPSANFMVQLEIWEQLGYQIWEDEAHTIPKKTYSDWIDQRLILCREQGLTGNEPDYRDPFKSF